VPLGNPAGGFAYSPEFQSSGLPWLTSSFATAQPQEWDFNYITRFITVVNLDTSGSLSIACTWSGSVGSNKVVVPPNAIVNFEWRVAKVFIKDEGGLPRYSLGVGLTTIPVGQMPPLSASFPDGTTNWQGVG
jgi:hypothetical protein